jgi:hypothetical protein
MARSEESVFAKVRRPLAQRLFRISIRRAEMIPIGIQLIEFGYIPELRTNATKDISSIVSMLSPDLIKSCPLENFYISS